MALKPSMGGLSPSSLGLALGYSMAVVVVRIYTLAGVSLFSPPAWHFCLYKRHDRPSILINSCFSTKIQGL